MGTQSTWSKQTALLVMLCVGRSYVSSLCCRHKAKTASRGSEIFPSGKIFVTTTIQNDPSQIVLFRFSFLFCPVSRLQAVVDISGVIEQSRVIIGVLKDKLYVFSSLLKNSFIERLTTVSGIILKIVRNEN